MEQSSVFDYGYKTIPNALMEYQSRLLFNTYTILENQLSQIDSTQSPEMYEEVNRLAQSVFDSWIALGYRGGEEV